MKRSIILCIAVSIVSSIVGAIIAMSFVDVTTPEENSNTNIKSSVDGDIEAIPDLSAAVENVSKAVLHVETDMGHGSGVVISEDGYIVTNYHVIEGDEQIVIRYTDGNTQEVEIIGYDEEFDIALLKADTEGKSLPYAKFGISDDLRQGEWVVALGYPYSLDLTMTVGIVSAKVRSNTDYRPFIQVDALINPGNSGGALINSRGELVGINTELAHYLFSGDERASYGYGCAIPADLVKKVVSDLREYGYVLRPSLGIREKNVTADYIKAVGERRNIQEVGGVIITSMTDNSAAHRAGLRENDVIIALNDIDILDRAAYHQQINMYRPGDVVKVSVRRNGVIRDFNVQLVDRDGNKMSTQRNVNISDIW